MTYVVNLLYDEIAGVWVATSDDIQGLVLESGSIDALIEKIKFAVPELLELNNDNLHPDINLHILSERYIKVGA